MKVQGTTKGKRESRKNKGKMRIETTKWSRDKEGEGKQGKGRQIDALGKENRRKEGMENRESKGELRIKPTKWSRERKREREEEKDR